MCEVIHEQLPHFFVYISLKLSLLSILSVIRVFVLWEDNTGFTKYNHGRRVCTIRMRKRIWFGVFFVHQIRELFMCDVTHLGHIASVKISIALVISINIQMLITFLLFIQFSRTFIDLFLCFFCFYTI